MASKASDEFTTRADTFTEEAGTSLKSAMDIVRKYGMVFAVFAFASTVKRALVLK